MIVMGSFSLGLLAGLVLGIAIMSVGFYWMIHQEKDGKLKLPKFLQRAGPLALMLVMGALIMLFGQSHVILAQTATIVPLDIPLGDIFVQANNWLQTLSPIESLAIGITIALAVFGFLYKAIKSAFG